VQSQCVSACNPACASGEICSQGRCVSPNCNPPCGPGETCSSGGICIVEQGYAPQTGYPPQPQTGYAPYAPSYAPPPPRPPAPPPQPGWAVGAGITGLVLAGGVGLFAGLSSYHAETYEGTDVVGSPGVSLGLGITALTLVAVGVPIVAIGGGSARGHPQVRGARALRVLGWITYGGTMLSSFILLSVSAYVKDNADERSRDQLSFPGWIAACGVVGGVSMLLMSLDAFISAGQSSSVRATYETPAEDGEQPATEPPAQGARLELVPTGGVAPGPNGEMVGFFGVAGAF
jgi:hypothetical protein